MKTRTCLLGMAILALIGCAVFVALSPVPATAQGNECATCMAKAHVELQECLALAVDLEARGKCIASYQEDIQLCREVACISR